MIACNAIIRAGIQSFGTSCMKNEHNSRSFIRIIVMDRQFGAGNYFIINTILTTLMTETVWDTNCNLKFTTTSKVASFIGEYTVHGHKYDISIPTGSNS